MRRIVTNSIAIIGEGATEWFYFDSLRVACRYPFKVAPDFPQHSDINHILKLLEAYLGKQYDYIVCLFDMDRLLQHASEMQVYQQAKKKYSAKRYAGKVMFVETNPCTEFWFLLHFLPDDVCRRYESYEQLFPNYRNICRGMKRQNDISHEPTYTNILRRMEIWNGQCQILRDCASSVRTRPKI